ncbi:Uncharacterised protein [Burkholderia pseudomallei]|nr:hypothetical protein DP58_5266 [Burkholderia pseudomallei]KGS90189.1 hypothetical protein X947_477 [Burkholderia pseudomallei MSHR7334]AIO92303.1 hypothetical protein DP48_3943 [Burkholderia pseudomallei]KGC72993.1 hypothetical protein DP61_806 [Burkholderia pseudomallei]CAJ2806006.1 Uncharacterised protein [Burkholderia pseudomallei]
MPGWRSPWRGRSRAAAGVHAHSAPAHPAPNARFCRARGRLGGLQARSVAPARASAVVAHREIQLHAVARRIVEEQLVLAGQRHVGARIPDAEALQARERARQIVA